MSTLVEFKIKPELEEMIRRRLAICSARNVWARALSVLACKPLLDIDESKERTYCDYKKKRFAKSVFGPFLVIEYETVAEFHSKEQIKIYVGDHLVFMGVASQTNNLPVSVCQIKSGIYLIDVQTYRAGCEDGVPNWEPWLDPKIIQAQIEFSEQEKQKVQKQKEQAEEVNRPYSAEERTLARNFGISI